MTFCVCVIHFREHFYGFQSTWILDDLKETLNQEVNPMMLL